MKRRLSTDVPDNSPTLRRGTLIALVTSDPNPVLYTVNIFGENVVAVLGDGRTPPDLDTDVDLYYNPVSKFYKIV